MSGRQEFVEGILGNDSNLAGSEGMMNLREDWIQKVVLAVVILNDVSRFSPPCSGDRASKKKCCRVK